jgi:peptide deformylase
MLDIITLGDEVLKEKCTPVETFDNALRMLVDAMFETLLKRTAWDWPPRRSAC